MPISNIPIDRIVPPYPVLRPVRENTIEFLELVDQIKARGGCLQAPPGRPLPDGRVQLADGGWRLRAYQVAGLTHMVINVMEMTDIEYMVIQIQCNSNKVDTDWIDYARHLDRLRKASGTEMTQTELADLVGRSKSWVGSILRLNSLLPHIKKQVQRDEIPIGNARWLAKLPKKQQKHYAADAHVMKTNDYQKVIATALREYKEAIRQGKLAVLGEDHLKLQMRDLKVIEAELESPSHLPLLMESAGCKTPMDGAILALKWAFRVNPDTIEERKANILHNERQRIGDANRRKEDRESLRFYEESEIKS